MTSRLHTATRRIRSFRGVAPDARWNAIQQVAAEQAGRLGSRARRRLLTSQVRVVEFVFGSLQANQFFWRIPFRNPTWFDVQQRIERLEAVRPDAVDHFVRQAIRWTHDPITIAGLARHPSGRGVLADLLRAAAQSLPAETVSRLSGDQVLGGAFVGAANVVLTSNESEAVTHRITELYDMPEAQFYAVADSLSWWPAGRPELPSGTPPRCVERRLVIAESSDDIESLALLLPGAAHTTFIAINDTFGTADFSAYAGWPGVGDTTVEHIRTHLTRFSQGYIDVHEATRSVAVRAAASVAELPGLVEPSDLGFLEVAIADFLFFQALKIRAIEVLSAQDFDHIVLATGAHGPSDEFVRLAASANGLTDDPRLEIVSVSRSASVRTRFWSVVEGLDDPAAGWVHSHRPVPARVVLRKFDALARHAADQLGRFPAGTRARVGFATANNGAYNESTAAYIGELLADYDVRVLHAGRNATSVAQHLNDTVGHSVPIDFIAPTAGRFESFVRMLTAQLTADVPTDSDGRTAQHAAERALDCCSRRLATDVVAPALERMRTLHHWFAALESTGELPDAFVLCPNRHVGVGVVASAARRFGVPTIAVEPHAQDANYCRYVKVAADYYGVMSEYFRSQTAQAFAVGDDRTLVIGSPRQVVPNGYDPANEQQRARHAAEHSPGPDRLSFPDGMTQLVFFGQPSDWGHVSQVWSNILAAAAETNSHVLLKPHPEESVSRRNDYLALAARCGAAELVSVLDGDAAQAIALADIVLTAYSSAGLDAAIRQQPVICVTHGQVEYPLDLSAMVDAHLARSTEDLVALITGYHDHPEEFHQRARSLLVREDQFLVGPGPRLRALLGQAIAAGTAGIRPPSDLPTSLFLDPPHPVFAV